ncbi:MAG: type II secretion system inner membrane protein GspF [Pseudomonadota bacterium]
MAPAFEYEALDAGGRSRKGILTAETPRQARLELRRLSMTPISLAAARSDVSAGGKGHDKIAKVPAGELVLVTRQLSVLIGAATPLEEAINAVALETDKPSVRKRLLTVRERITEGRRFADALREDPKSFSDLYCSVVEAGERSGRLADVLDRLATMLEKTRAMRNKALGALIYPAVLFLFAGGVVTGLMTLVVPQIVDQFRSFDAELPTVTQFVVGMSNFLSSYGGYILGFLVATGIAVWQATRFPNVKYQLDRMVLLIPVLGPLLRGLDGARFARTLSTLFGGDAPLLESLSGAQRTVGNSYIRSRLDTAIDYVREGGSLAAAVKKSEALPSMMAHMVAAGERSGELPKLLDRAAEQLEDEFDTASTVALRLLEPIIIVIMGGIVMLITVAIMLPILRLNALAAL